MKTFQVFCRSRPREWVNHPRKLLGIQFHKSILEVTLGLQPMMHVLSRADFDFHGGFERTVLLREILSRDESAAMNFLDMVVQNHTSVPALGDGAGFTQNVDGSVFHGEPLVMGGSV